MVSQTPEIRYRIRLDSHTGTVEEGALFDMETGYQGIIFPFRIHFATEKKVLEPYLWKVLDHWKNDQAVLGGSTGTGFGRFKLEKFELFFWNLSSAKEHELYLQYRGFKGSDFDEIKKWVQKIEKRWPRTRKWNDSFKPTDVPISELPWEEISYEIQIASPLISRDPIAAMLDERNTDTVTIRKTVLEPDEKAGNKLRPKDKYFIKGESIRGILRSILARNEGTYDDDHEDCDCIQCRLFGSIHKQGRLRFEDAVVSDDKPVSDKKMDHVAIDRFTGGALDQMKFDDYPLAGSRHHLLIWQAHVIIS